MNLSLFLLAFYVLLQSAPVYGWFDAAPKLTAFVGIAFVVVLVLEAFTYFRTGHTLWHRNNQA